MVIKWYHYIPILMSIYEHVLGLLERVPWRMYH
jgi:hypothetical protein